MPNAQFLNPERFRPLLQLQVRLLRPHSRFSRRFDSSDLVQETMLKAVKNQADFRGDTDAELVKWLQEILKNVVTDAVRKATAGKRDVRVEQSLQDALAQSSVRLEEYLAAQGPSPSRQAELQEMLFRLAAALDQLPEDQREVIIQRDLHGDPVAEIAAQLGKTKKAVAGLLQRGRKKLTVLLANYR